MIQKILKSRFRVIGEIYETCIIDCVKRGILDTYDKDKGGLVPNFCNELFKRLELAIYQQRQQLMK